ncbi:PREDICTED: separase-like [Brassica oleracea var. oleracea]|uniref:separase-like n=1 Tax=Brassica oleracea var. oleracea TaxID=109376 RepID=UPI0006A70B3D|nr:PREDICTED: separase-like [Brassica oleracea var. oleracea]
MSRSLEERPQNFPAEKCRFIDESDISDAKGLMRDTRNTICVCINRISQQHLSNEVTRSGLPNNFISLKWQFYQRRLACTVLVSLGKCLAKSGKVHQAHGVILHSIAALYNSTVSILSSPSSRSPLLDFIGKEIKGDVFGLDRARILYNLCKLSLQTYHSRSVLCDLSHIPYQTLVSLLTLAFVLSREDPILCRKISRLLAVLYLVSSIGSEFSFPCDGELSLSHWVTYYHQASLGANINYHFLSKFIKSGRNSNKEASQEFDFLRLAPKSTDGLVKFAKNFFNGLPETTAICISVLGGTLSKLLQELLKSPQVCGWLLLSRLSSKSQQPLAVLLPIYSSLGEGGIEKMDKRWDSPWGSTVVDVVAPAFRLILKEYNFAGSQVPMEDEKLRWKEIDELELRLNKLLRNLEDTWLGPWRHLLLGESSNSKSHESTQKKLVEELRAKCNMEVNETLLKVFLGNETADGGDAWISQLCSKNGCYIGGHPSDHIDEENWNQYI